MGSNIESMHYTLLPASSDEEQQSHTRSSPTAAVNQTRTCKEENTFIQSQETNNES